MAAVSGIIIVMQIQKKNTIEQLDSTLDYTEMHQFWVIKAIWDGHFQSIGFFISSLRLWNKICKMESSYLTRIIFEWSLQNFTSDTWECHIFNILESVNLMDCFLMENRWIFPLLKANLMK